MTRRTLIPVPVSLLLLAACAPVESTIEPDLPALAGDRSQPLLALADHVVADYFAQDIASRPTVCLAHTDGGQDRALDASFEKALMQRHENLAPFARCEWADGGWQDAASEQPALVFTIHSFTCADAETCRGWSGYQAGAASSMSYEYRMDWDGEHWLFERSAGIIADAPGAPAD